MYIIAEIKTSNHYREGGTVQGVQLYLDTKMINIQYMHQK